MMTNVIVLDAAQGPAVEPTVEHAVAIGARMLTLRRFGWWDVADLATLDQAYPERCVLGQVYGGNWLDGLVALFPDLNLPALYRAAERSGFWVNDHQPDGEPVQSDASLTRYEDLTKAWRAAIVAHRDMWR